MREPNITQTALQPPPTATIDSADSLASEFTALFGHPPRSVQAGAGQGSQIALAGWIDTPLGGMIAIADNDALHLLEFHDRKSLVPGLRRVFGILDGRIGLGRTAIHDRIEAELDDYFAARSARFDTPLALHGTEFQKAAWQGLRDIPVGETRSYKQLASAIGRPTAVRAVAAANGRNQLAVIIPCHRVIGADGRMVGYAGGLWRKEKLITLEKRMV